MSLRPKAPSSSNALQPRRDPDAVGGEERLGAAADDRHDGVVALVERPQHGPDECGSEQRRVDAAGERDVGLPGERHEAGVERGERPVVGDRIVDHDRVERRQLLPRRADDADRSVADSLAHHRDRVLDGRLPVPVEERLGSPIRLDRPPARTTAPALMSAQGRAPGRAGSRSGP